MWTALLLLAASGLDDATIYRLAGGPFELHSLLSRTVMSDPAVQREVRRVGTPAGCAALYRAQRRVGDRHDAAFRPLLIAAVRRQVPAGVLDSERTRVNIGFVANPALGAHRGKVLDNLARTAATTILNAERDLRDQVANEFASPLRMPGTAGAWSRDRPGSLESACLSYVAEHRDAVFADLPVGAR